MRGDGAHGSRERTRNEALRRMASGRRAAAVGAPVPNPGDASRRRIRVPAARIASRMRRRMTAGRLGKEGYDMTVRLVCGTLPETWPRTAPQPFPMPYRPSDSGFRSRTDVYHRLRSEASAPSLLPPYRTPAVPADGSGSARTKKRPTACSAGFVRTGWPPSPLRSYSRGSGRESAVLLFGIVKSSGRILGT